MKTTVILLTVLMVGLLGCGDTDRSDTQLHKEAIVADMHSDTPLRMRRGFDFSGGDTTGHMDIPRLQQGGVDLQVFACFLSTDTPPDQCRSVVDELIDTLETQISRSPDKIATCTTAAQAESIIQQGKIAAFIGIENGVAINGNLDNLQHFYDRSVRYLTLTHTSSS